MSQKALDLWDMGWAVTEANATVRQRVPVVRQIRAFKLALRRRSGGLVSLENPVQFEMLRDGKLPRTARMQRPPPERPPQKKRLEKKRSG